MYIIFSGKAVIPDRLVSDEFNAKLWMESVAACVSGKCQPPKGRDSLISKWEKIISIFREKGYGVIKCKLLSL